MRHEKRQAETPTEEYSKTMPKREENYSFTLVKSNG